jgi:hypothetical protein
MRMTITSSVHDRPMHKDSIEIYLVFFYGSTGFYGF